MNKLYNVLLVAVLLPFFSLAQSNYKTGYIVNLKGDTIHGFIDYKEWDNNPKEITFKDNLNGNKSENYSTKNAAAFSITGLEQYQRFVLPISTDPTEVSKLATSLDTTTIIDTVFLKVNTTGRLLTLFRYTDDIKSRFFLLEAGDSQPFELIYHAYYNADKSSSVQYIPRYRSQLEYLAQKYGVSTGVLDRKILAGTYSESGLIKIVQAINEDSSQPSSAKSLSGLRWFAGIGVNYSNLKLITAEDRSFNPQFVNNSGSAFPAVSAGLDFFPNKNVQRLFIRTEVSLTASKYSITSNFIQYNGSIIPQIIYNVYNKEQLKIFIGAGAAFNFSEYNQYQDTKYQWPLPPAYIENNYPVFNKFWLSFPIKIGVTFNNKIEVNLCYIPPAYITNDFDPAFVGSVAAYQVGVHYLFGK